MPDQGHQAPHGRAPESVSNLAINNPAHLEDNHNQSLSFKFDPTVTIQPPIQPEQDPSESVGCFAPCVLRFPDADIIVFWFGPLRKFPKYSHHWRHFCKSLS